MPVYVGSLRCCKKNEKKVGLRVLYVGPHADVVVASFPSKRNSPFLLKVN